MNIRHGRIAAGLLGLALSIAYLWSAFTLPFGTIARPGAAIFPIISGAVLAIASATLVLQQYSRRARARLGEMVQLPRNADLRRVLVFAAAMVLYIPLLNLVGYVGATLILTVVLLRTLKVGSRAWWRVALVSVAVTLTTWFLFVELLSVHLPNGTLL